MGRVALERVGVTAGTRTLLHDVTFTVAPGDLVAIVGPNGVGKSSLLRAIAGIDAPASGTLTIDGRAPRALDARTRARIVTLIASDALGAPGTNVRDVVATGRFAYRRWWDWSEDAASDAAIDAALARMDLLEEAERPFDTLSSGERQRAYLALALAQDAGVVLLDEPTSHLDPRYVLETLCAVRGIASSRRAAIVVLHDLNEAAAVADRVAVLGERTVLAFDRPERALRPEILAHAYGIEFECFERAGTLRILPRGLSRVGALVPTET